MKIRFPLKANATDGSSQWLGIDTDEIVAFQLDKHNHLHLWYRGISEPVVITQKEIGADYFKDLLTLICSDFQNIDDAKPRIALLADLHQPLNLDR
ncbi:hypothetical protein [Microcoleus sp. MON2_D5]|uniref:hypothetical protein n=1 Tax=Microcoleus sp. MON2_D5 TaxID=2818833 RepID=UPI002FCE9927